MDPLCALEGLRECGGCLQTVIDEGGKEMNVLASD